MYACVCIFSDSFGSANHHRPSTTFHPMLLQRAYTVHKVHGWNHSWCCTSQLWYSPAQASFGFGDSDRQISYRLPPTMIVCTRIIPAILFNVFKFVRQAFADNFLSRLLYAHRIIMVDNLVLLNLHLKYHVYIRGRGHQEVKMCGQYHI